MTAIPVKSFSHYSVDFGQSRDRYSREIPSNLALFPMVNDHGASLSLYGLFEKYGSTRSDGDLNQSNQRLEAETVKRDGR